MAKRVREIENWSLLNRLRPHMSLDYRSRIPEATRRNIDSISDRIFQWTPIRNEFIQALTNRIGDQIIRDTIWSNPLARFKRGMMRPGDTIEDIQTGLIKASSYSGSRDVMEKEIWGRESFEVSTLYHTINREDRYKYTIDTVQLRRAFDTETGLSRFINKIAETPITSDAHDEFMLMCKLFNEYENAGGYFKVYTPEIPLDVSAEAGNAAKYLLKQIRATSQNLTYLSRDYNAAHMPTFAPIDKQVLFTTPEIMAAIDVDALAAAFNIDRMDIAQTVYTLPKNRFDMRGVDAILTTEDFFVVADTLIESTSIYNPAGLYENNFLHHHAIISMSLHAPAVAFGQLTPTEVIEISDPVTAIAKPEAYDATGNKVESIERGKIYQITAANTGGNNGDIRFRIKDSMSDYTRISGEGILTVDPFDEAKTIKVIAFANMGFARVESEELELTISGSVVNPLTVPKLTHLTVLGETVKLTTKDAYTIKATGNPTKDDVKAAISGEGYLEISVSGKVATVKVFNDAKELLRTVTVTAQ